MDYDEAAAAVAVSDVGDAAVVVVATVVAAAAVVEGFAAFADAVETFVVADVAAFQYFYLNY